MASSFDKVCKHLTDTPDFKSYLLRIGEVLDQANICGWEFYDSGDVYGDTRGVALPEYKFLIDWGKNPESQDMEPVLIQKVWKSSAEHFLIETDEFCAKSALLKVVRDNFGTKKCPSYNCKKDKVEEKFVTFARRMVSDFFLDKIDKTQTRLREEMKKTQESEAFKKARIAHHERYIVEDFKKMLVKYNKVLSPDILRQSFDEYVCHALMES